jgi:hypothetical protein
VKSSPEIRSSVRRVHAAFVDPSEKRRPRRTGKYQDRALRVLRITDADLAAPNREFDTLTAAVAS